MRIRDPGPNNRLLGDDGPYRGIAGEKAQQPSTPCGLRRRTSRSRWPDPATNLAWLPDHYDCVCTKHTSVRFLILVVVQLLNGGRLIIEAPVFSWSKLEPNHRGIQSRHCALLTLLAIDPTSCTWAFPSLYILFAHYCAAPSLLVWAARLLGGPRGVLS